MHSTQYIPQRKTVIRRILFNTKFIAFLDSNRKGNFDFYEIIEDFVDDKGVTDYESILEYDPYNSDNLSESCNYAHEDYKKNY